MSNINYEYGGVYFSPIEQQEDTRKICGTFWGSHGCDLEFGHDPEEKHPIHRCLVFAEREDDEELSEELELCVKIRILSDEEVEVSYDPDSDGGEWAVYPNYVMRLDNEEVR